MFSVNSSTPRIAAAMIKMVLIANPCFLEFTPVTWEGSYFFQALIMSMMSLMIARIMAGFKPKVSPRI